MAHQQHIIERRVLDLTLPAGADADRVLEHDALDWAEGFSAADARLFDDICPGPDTLVINRLEVDLDAIKPDIAFDDLLRLYRQAVASRLQDIIDNTPDEMAPASYGRRSDTAARRHGLFEAAAYFLEAGTLPDWHQPAPEARTEALRALAQAITDTARLSPALISEWLTTADTAWPVIRRAVAQFGDAAAESILAALPGHLAAHLLETAKTSTDTEGPRLRQVLERCFHQEMPGSSHPHDKVEPLATAHPDEFLPGPDEADATHWPEPQPREPFAGAAEERPRSSDGPPPVNASKQSAEAQPEATATEDPDTRPTKGPPPARKDQAHAAHPAQPCADGPLGETSAAQGPAAKGGLEATSAQPDLDEASQEVAKHQAPELQQHKSATPRRKDGHPSEPVQREDGQTHQPPGARTALETDHALPHQGALAPAGQAEAHPQAREAGFSPIDPAAPAHADADDGLPRRKPQATEAAAQPVRNAGVVLLGPFLPTFFTRLEMLDDDGWRSPDLAARAVHLVHYLASGETETPQYDLPLAMVMCGLPLNTVLPLGITLTDAETEQAEGLLSAALGHWPQMAGTSIDGLRATFLLRSGLLSEEETCWRLRVEPGPFDILLDSLPWPYRTLMLSWMPKMLEVEW